MGKKIDTMYENARTELKQWEQSFISHETIRDTIRIWCLRNFCSFIEIVKGKKEV